MSETQFSVAQRHVYGEARAFAAAMQRLMPFIRRTAWRIADGDPEFADDLAQEALIALWELDPSRFDVDDQMYLKRALVRRMINAAEHECLEATGLPRSSLREYLALR